MYPHVPWHLRFSLTIVMRKKRAFLTITNNHCPLFHSREVIKAKITARTFAAIISTPRNGREGIGPPQPMVTRWRTACWQRKRARPNRARPAEGKGFEPLVHCCTTVFKTAAFDRSAIPPVRRKGTLFSASSSYREARRPAPRCPRVASVSFTLPVNVLLEARLCRRLE